MNFQSEGRTSLQSILNGRSLPRDQDYTSQCCPLPNCTIISTVWIRCYKSGDDKVNGFTHKIVLIMESYAVRVRIKEFDGEIQREEGQSRKQRSRK